MSSTYRGGESPNPFERSVDRLLEGLRRVAVDSYRLMPGDPARSASVCPLHPSTGFAVLITEVSDDDADVWCRGGCPGWAVKYALISDPERDREVARRAQVLVWAQSYRKAVAA